MTSNITNVRELFLVIANHFNTVVERQPYYIIVRSILKEYGNINITDVKDDMLQEDEMKLYREILGFAGVVQEVLVEVPEVSEVSEVNVVVPKVQNVPKVPVVVPVVVPEVPKVTAEKVKIIIADQCFMYELPTYRPPGVKIEYSIDYNGVCVTLDCAKVKIIIADHCYKYELPSYRPSGVKIQYSILTPDVCVSLEIMRSM